MATKAEIKKALRRMLRYEKQHAALAGSMENRLLSSLRRAERKTLKRILAIMDTMPSAKAASKSQLLAWYLQKRNDMHRAFIDSGYLESVTKYITNYDAVSDLVGKMVAAGGMVDQSMISFPAEIIEQLKSRDALFFKELNASATAYFDRTFLNSVIAGDSKYGLLPKMRGLITGDYAWGSRRGLYEWHAGTYARTLHRRFSRSINAAMASENGYNKFLYVGPVDAKVRRSCQAWLYEIFTREEIDGLDNGQTGDVMTDGGGYNCRHNWRALSDEMAKAIQESDESVADMAAAPPPPPPPPAAPEVPRFKDHKEAREWWKSNMIADGGACSIKGIPLEMVQGYADEFYRIAKDINGWKLAQFKGTKADSYIARVWSDRRLYFSKPHVAWWESKGFTPAQYFKNAGADGWFATGSIKGHCAHEAVHYWQFNQGGGYLRAMRDDFGLLWKTAKSNAGGASAGKKYLQKMISRYSLYEGKALEFFAECGSKCAIEGTGWIPESYRKLIMRNIPEVYR